jgi:opacity protein-like surface antigen
MKRNIKLFSCTSLIALLAMSPAIAADLIADEIVPIETRMATDWVIGAYVGKAISSYENNGGEAAFIGGAEARFHMWATDVVSLQLDLDVEKSGELYDGDHGSRTMYQVGGHLNYRTDAGSIGVFGSKMHFTQFNEGVETRYLVGIEGQAYLGNVTLYGQYGIGDLINGDENHGEMVDNRLVRGVIRWFPVETAKVELDMVYEWSDDNETGGQGPLYHKGIALSYEQQFANKPHLSWFSEFSFNRRNDSSHNEVSADEKVFMVGLKLRPGSASLLQRDRQGVSYDLPMTMRQHSWADPAH